MLRRGGPGGQDGHQGHPHGGQGDPDGCKHKLEAGVAEINNSLCNAMFGIVLSDEVLRFLSHEKNFDCKTIFEYYFSGISKLSDKQIFPLVQWTKRLQRFLEGAFEKMLNILNVLMLKIIIDAVFRRRAVIPRVIMMSNMQ